MSPYTFSADYISRYFGTWNSYCCKDFKTDKHVTDSVSFFYHVFIMVMTITNHKKHENLDYFNFYTPYDPLIDFISHSHNFTQRYEY